MLERPIVLLTIVIGGCERGRLRTIARLHGTQFGRLGFCHGFCVLALVDGRFGSLAATFARQLVGSLRYLRFKIFHGRRDIEIAAAISTQIHVECSLEFSGHVAVESSCRRWFLRHAFATLY